MSIIGNRQFVIETLKNLTDLAARKTTTLGENISSQEAAYYCDNEQLTLEKDALFRKVPLFVGLSGDLPRPGDARAQTVADVPLLLVRQADGSVKAFLNACRHRGAKLVRERCQQVGSRLTCPYHLWTYRQDGSLLGVSHSQTFGAVDKPALGLVELPCKEKYGLIYAALTRDVSIDIDEILGDRCAEFANWNLGGTAFVEELEVPWQINWKLAADTYCENYHFAGAHKTTLAPIRMTNCSSTWRFGYDERNHVVTFPHQDILKIVDKEESVSDPINLVTFIYFLFPNTFVSIFEKYCVIWRIYPGANAGESITIGSAYARGSELDGERADAARAGLSRIGTLLVEEDYPLAGDAATAFASGLLPYALFGRNELELTGMHNAWQRAIEELS